MVAFKCEDGATSASTTNRFCVLAKERVCRIFFFFLSCAAKYILNIYIVSHNVFAVHPQSLKLKCVIIRSKDKLHVIPLQNNIERD